MKKKKVCNGHVTVARGMGVANGHMTVGGRAGGGKEGGLGRGQAGPPLWARRAHHSGPVRPVLLGPSGPLFLGPSGPPSIKHVGWPQALKKIKFRPGSNRAAGLT